MKLEQQVTSLEISKRLKELGVKQESLFTWHTHSYRQGGRRAKGAIDYTGGKFVEEPSMSSVRMTENWYKESEGHIADHGIDKWHFFSAFTVAELGEMLPFRSKKMGTINDAMFICRKSWSGNATAWNVYYEDEDNGQAVTPRFWDTNEADARGKMLIYLIENKLIEVIHD